MQILLSLFPHPFGVFTRVFRLHLLQSLSVFFVIFLPPLSFFFASSSSGDYTSVVSFAFNINPCYIRLTPSFLPRVFILLLFDTLFFPFSFSTWQALVNVSSLHNTRLLSWLCALSSYSLCLSFLLFFCCPYFFRILQSCYIFASSSLFSLERLFVLSWLRLSSWESLLFLDWISWRKLHHILICMQITPHTSFFFFFFPPVLLATTLMSLYVSWLCVSFILLMLPSRNL